MSTRMRLLLVVIVCLGTACGSTASDSSTGLAPTSSQVEAVEPSASASASASADGITDSGSKVVSEEAPDQVFGPKAAAFEDGVLVWGTTPDGGGAVALVDSEGAAWIPIEAAGPIPVCSSAVELDGNVLLLGNTMLGSEQVIGLTIDLSARKAQPVTIPDVLAGSCPRAVAADSGLMAWTTSPEADTPVDIVYFDNASLTWEPRPPPPFPAGTYESGGVWTSDGLVLLAATEGRPTFIGARLDADQETWHTLQKSQVAAWETPDPIWSGRELIVTSSWPQLITGGEVNPFPEPLAPGGTYRPSTDTWRPSTLAPEWTDGVPVWTGEVVIWWRPGNEHATVYDPEGDRWWHISAPAPVNAPAVGDILWAAAWNGTRIVATDGADLFALSPNLDDEVELDRSGKPRTDASVDPGAVAGSRRGRLGLLGQACGFRGRNAITIDITESNNFTLDYVIDREEPCGSVIVHEGAITGTIDPASRQLIGDGPALVDGTPAEVRCDCEITSNNQVRGELVIDGTSLFIVTFAKG